MEAGDKKKYFLYFRATLCLLLIVAWTVYLNILPKRIKKQEIKSTVSENKKNLKPIQKRLDHNLPQPVITMQSIELPKLATLIEIKQKGKEIDSGINETIENKKSSEHAHDNSHILETIEEIMLRPLLAQQIIHKNYSKIEDKWIPQYIRKRGILNSNINHAAKKLDKIAEQLEFIGLVNNPRESKAAIIKNTTTKEIKVVKIGEIYQQLKLQEINDTEIVLGNQNLNKKYFKRLKAN